MRFTIVVAALLVTQHLHAAELALRGKFTWKAELQGFGGYSAIWVSPDGQKMIAISDRGRFVEANLSRSKGRIADIEVTRDGPLGQRPVKNVRRTLDDAEGIARAPDGRFYISFEGTSRIWAYSDLATTPTATHRPQEFDHLQTNSGLEALAIDAEGAIYAIPERSGKWTRPFPVYRSTGGTWDAKLNIPRSKRFLVVGADFGPDGQLYVLERDAEQFSGVKTRVRRFKLSPDGFDDGETIYETFSGSFDNAEGISIWADESDALILTLITDNNFNPLISTKLLEFELIENAE